MSDLTPRKFFEELNASYPNYQSFLDNVVAHFNQHLGDFPPDYSYRDLIDDARRSEWITRGQDGVITVHISSSAQLTLA